MRQKKFLAVLLAAMFLSSLAFAAVTEEKITLSTYYPAPYGVYEELFVSGTPSTTLGIGPSFTVNPVLIAGADGDILTAVRIKPDFQYETGVDPSTVKRYGLIVETGNVGIGTTEPERRLHIKGSGPGCQLYLETPGGDGGISFKNADGRIALIKYDRDSDAFEFRTNGEEPIDARMVITDSGNVGIGTKTPAAEALLDVSSATKGFLPPRMTTVQRTTIASPPEGLMIYNTDTNKLNFYDGTAWREVTST